MFMFEKAVVGSRRYWLWVLSLVTVIGLGLISYLCQLANGLGVTGLSRDVTWGLYIAQVTFFVGVAASAVMVVLPYYLHNFKVFGKITILGEFLAISAVTMCVLFIFVDMGQRKVEHPATRRRTPDVWGCPLSGYRSTRRALVT
jgi:molybdopterin-containing oxidoreductase family membrane subunit